MHRQLLDFIRTALAETDDGLVEFLAPALESEPYGIVSLQADGKWNWEMLPEKKPSIPLTAAA
jgi:VCBS repeat-containing protein